MKKSDFYHRFKCVGGALNFTIELKKLNKFILRSNEHITHRPAKLAFASHAIVRCVQLITLHLPPTRAAFAKLRHGG